jgi:hypothetical protein
LRSLNYKINYYRISIVIEVLAFFYVVRGPAADATDAPQLFCNPCDEDEQFFLPSCTSNGAPVE